jgi:magnesium transporter
MTVESTPESTSAAFFARLFTTKAQARELPLGELARLRRGDEELAWVDLRDPEDNLLSTVWSALDLPLEARTFVRGGTMPEVAQLDACFWVRCAVVDAQGEKHALTGSVLVCVARPNCVVTVHLGTIPFLDEMRDARHGQAAIGGLSAESFVATLLDRQLASYFEAVSDYEMAIERLEVDLMGKHSRDSLPELQRLRRWASRLRRMLAPHRNVFGVLARPDFRPDEGKEADRHFVALDTRFERAMDMVEHARELVIGSFELFSSQTALRTNDAMRILTFVTVIVGLLATMVGALGMNFQASFFASNDVGFWTAVAGLVAFALAALLLGRHRRWF